MLQRVSAPATALAISLLSLLLLAGCAFSRGELGTPIKAEDLALVQRGQMSEAQVVALLGPPDEIRPLGRRELFHYYRYVLKHATVIVFSRANIASDELYVLFNEHGVVDQVIAGNRTDQIKFQFWPFGS